MRPSTMDDPIVITGMGAACALGVSAREIWRRILKGDSHPAKMEALESAAPDDGLGYQSAALPADFAPNLPRAQRYLRWVLTRALQQARNICAAYTPARGGIVLGTTLHGMRAGGRFLRNGNYGELAGFLAADVLKRSVDCTGASGDALTTCSACSSSLGAVALGITLLEAGELDWVIAGGYDTASEYAYAGFSSLRLVADGPLRPFARDRSGMKLGEGYGVLVLERQAKAQARGAEILSQIAGFGESADAHHLTQPHPDGHGAAAAIQAALCNAGLSCHDIGLIAAHATGTPDNDAGEYAALATVFGDELPRIPVVGFKSHIGHALGGAGALELILSIMALREQVIPPCLNVAPDNVEFAGLNVAISPPRQARIPAVLNLSLGFGGANTAMILQPPATSALTCSPAASRRKTQIAETESPLPVLITGIGIVLPGSVGKDAFSAALASNGLARQGPIDQAEYLHLLNAKRVRRMNEYVKLTLASAALACQDAGIEGDGQFMKGCPAILGSTHGSPSYCLSYYGQIVREGMTAANPMLFAEGVPNAAAAHLSLMLGLTGSCQTIIGSRTAGLDALRQAAMRIASGRWDRAIVSAAEEFEPQVNNAYAHFGLYNDAAPLRTFGDGSGFRASAGAVTLILESAQSLRRRGGNALGRIVASSSARFRRADAARAIRRVWKNLGEPSGVIGSANNTPVDHVEQKALASRLNRSTGLASLYGYWGELFSVGPLAAIAAAICNSEFWNSSFGMNDNPNFATPNPKLGNPSTIENQTIAVIGTGYGGTVTGVAIGRR